MSPYNLSDAIDITSPANPRIKDLVRLRDGTHRRRMGLVLIEGYRELTRALASGITLDELYVCPEFFLGDNEGALIEAARKTGARLYRLSKPPFEKISYRDRPDGLIATAPKLGLTLEQLTLTANPLLIVAERIEKPGNLGTILRSADAVGVDAVIVCDPTTDINNPNVVRASTGTLFTVPVAESDGATALSWLRERGIKILAATPHAEAIYTEVDLSGPVAIAVGAEQYGLTDTWMEQADIKVRIPMAGVADSLNVATATTVLLFEATRQRGFKRR
jgi:TrmH family RNA methyltransferase